jgi:hypothetical protein
MLRWEDQELNHATPENKFPEVFYAGHFLPMLAAKQQGKFLQIDQAALERMVASGTLNERARGVRIDRLCLHCRLFCRLGPGGGSYPEIGAMHFWRDSESLYIILHISPANDWVGIMVVSGECPRGKP